MQKSPQTCTTSHEISRIPFISDSKSQQSRISGAIDNYFVKRTMWLADVIDNTSWPMTLLVILTNYLVPVFLFGAIYNWIQASNPDVECVRPMLNKTSSKYIEFCQFAFETQSTIGYGYHSPSSDCLALLLITWIQYFYINAFSSPIILGIFLRKVFKHETVAIQEEKEELIQKNNSIYTNLKQMKACQNNDLDQMKEGIASVVSEAIGKELARQNFMATQASDLETLE